MKKLLLLSLLSVVPNTHASNTVNETASPVGMRMQIQDLIIPGNELEAKPLSRDSTVVLRITSVYPHGDSFRYGLEYYGLEPGSFNLGDYFQRKDKGTMSKTPEIPVKFKATLPAERIRPNVPNLGELPRFIKYKSLLVLGASFWTLGLLALIFGGRRRRELEELPAPMRQSVEERLRPLVEAARIGKLGKSGQAKLERALISFWSNRLGVTEESPTTALSKIKANPEAAPLFKQLESWFHCPEPEKPSDLNALLEPYRDPTVD